MNPRRNDADEETPSLYDSQREEIFSRFIGTPSQNVEDITILILNSERDGKPARLNEFFNLRNIHGIEKQRYIPFTLQMIEEAATVNEAIDVYKKRAKKTTRVFSRLISPAAGCLAGYAAGMFFDSATAEAASMFGMIAGITSDALTGWPSKYVERWVESAFFLGSMSYELFQKIEDCIGIPKYEKE